MTADQPAPAPSRYFEKLSYLVSAARFEQCPADSGREVAFAGRSNAGKSSAINALTRNSKLARTSRTPGRTRLFNFFLLETGRRLVDLPGYGFARVPEAVREQWHIEINHYLRRRQSLAGLVLVMDSRHPLSDFDRTLLDWAHSCELPVHVLLSKADKLKKAALNRQLGQVRAALGAYSNSTSVQVFSAPERRGVDTLADRLRDWLAADTTES